MSVRLASTALLAVLLGSPPVLDAQVAGAPRESCELELREVIQGADTTSARRFTSGTGESITYISGGVDATCRGQGNRLLADSAEHYSARGMLILFRNVRYTEPSMRLTAELMTYYTVDERLVATGNVNGSTASGTRFAGPEMEYFRPKPGLRAVARWRAPGRPTVRMSPAKDGDPAPVRLDSLGNVVSDSVDVTADVIISENDSLDILMPGQRLREVRALGRARAVSRSDSLRIVTEEVDWISGDTLVATFDTAAVADSTDQPQMRTVVATGTARSFYQMAPAAAGKGLPNISYSRGRVITVAFEDGEARTVDVIDKASGVFLEPTRADSTARASAPPRPPVARPERP